MSFPAAMVLSNLTGLRKMLDSQHNKVTELFVIKLIFPQEESEAGYENGWRCKILSAQSLEKRAIKHYPVSR